MRSPAFPPRRPSHLIRYVFAAALLVCIVYYLTDHADDRLPVSIPGAYLSTGDDTPQRPVPSDDAAPVVKPPEHSEVSLPVDPDNATHTAEGVEEVEDKEGKGKEKEKTIDQHPLENPKTPAEPDNDDLPISHVDDDEKPNPTSTHPIDKLIKVAEQEFNDLVANEASSLNQAAHEYRKRRGRHPPPGFNKWYKFAKEHDAVIVEDFFDQIYHDLNPFWGIDAKRIRKEAWDFEMTINIRDGNATAESDWFWTEIWLEHIKTIEHLLPDMDLALNAMDEPRLVVPYEDMADYMKKSDKTRALAPARKVVSDFQRLPAPGETENTPNTRKKNWEESGPYWQIARRGCAPDSPARKNPIAKSFDEAPGFTPSWATPHMYQGYVTNSSLSREFCHQPDLQALEGIFVKPLSIRSTKVLFPMFGGSKLATNNEILLPAPMYLNEEERFTGGDYHGPSWYQKTNALVWRGVATGGRHDERHWKGFQRHRFVSLANGTKVTRAEEEIEAPINFELPESIYNLAAQKQRRLGEWSMQWSDAGFTDLFCDPDIEPKPEDGYCGYLDDQFEVVQKQDLAVQYDYKYLPDIDGNSFSGRYLGFLRSTSLPLKSTMFREWHDSRLVAWKHFVPMDNRFGDYYGIMEYFMGYEDIVPAHDEAAKKIALEGKDWAEKVLRKEDMQIYTLRLLLEYARVSDERREMMGWVEDIIS